MFILYINHQCIISTNPSNGNTKSKAFQTFFISPAYRTTNLTLSTCLDSSIKTYNLGISISNSHNNHSWSQLLGKPSSSFNVEKKNLILHDKNKGQRSHFCPKKSRLTLEKHRGPTPITRLNIQTEKMSTKNEFCRVPFTKNTKNNSSKQKNTQKKLSKKNLFPHLDNHIRIAAADITYGKINASLHLDPQQPQEIIHSNFLVEGSRISSYVCEEWFVDFLFQFQTKKTVMGVTLGS